MKGIWRLALLLVWISTGPAAEPQGSHSHSDQGAANLAWSELQATMQRMHTDMASVDPSGDTDVDFVRLMLPHHRAAIEMAKIQLVRGSGPQMRRLAQEIITDQQSEIELMQLWLKRRNLDSPQLKPKPAGHANKEQ